MEWLTIFFDLLLTKVLLPSRLTNQAGTPFGRSGRTTEFSPQRSRMGRSEEKPPVDAPTSETVPVRTRLACERRPGPNGEAVRVFRGLNIGVDGERNKRFKNSHPLFCSWYFRNPKTPHLEVTSSAAQSTVQSAKPSGQAPDLTEALI